jgi:hypothetical protein
VALNRDARVTALQLLALTFSGLWRIILGLPTAAGGVALAWAAPSSAGVTGGFGAFIILLVGLAFLGLGAYVSWRGFSFLGDAVTRKVAYVTGHLDRETKTYKGSTFYYMLVGPSKTSISHKTYKALPIGMLCHAYYAPGSLHLFSVEPGTAAEPHPSLRFGGDAAHAWDRLRWPWLVGAVAAFGLAAGANGVFTAHPAQMSWVSGSISDYVVTHGKHDSYYLYLEGDPNQYNMDQLASQIPDLHPFTGDHVDLYTNNDTGTDVIALRLREILYAGDLYLHPEHEYWSMAGSGIAVIVLSGVTLTVIAWGINRLRKTQPGQRDDS